MHLPARNGPMTAVIVVIPVAYRLFRAGHAHAS